MSMTNEELVANLEAMQSAMQSAVAEVRAAVANANAAAATANAAANQASAGAAASVTGARTESNREQAQASATESVLKQISQQIESDVNDTEAQRIGLATISRAWNANEKRTYDLHQTMDTESFSRNRLHFDHAITQYQTLVANLNHLTVTQMTNLQNQSNIQNLNGVESAKIGSDRMWNVNETDWAAVSMATFVNKVLAEMQKQNPSTGS